MSPVITQDHTLPSAPFYPTGASKQLCFALCKRPLPMPDLTFTPTSLSLFAIISGSPECSRRNMGYNSQPSLPCQLLRLTCDLYLNSNSITTCSHLVGCNYSLKRNSETLHSPTSSHSLLLVLLHSIFSKTFGQSCSLHDFTSGFGCSLTYSLSHPTTHLC